MTEYNSSATYEESRFIRAYDIDFQNELKVNAIFNIMQEIASVHADNLRLGFDDLRELNLAWVLSWAKVEICSNPKFGEPIHIRTWPKEKHKLYSMRDFLLFDEGQNVIAKATTAWLLINTVKKRITDPATLPITIPYQTETHALREYPQKIIAQNEKTIVFSKTFHYTDIDVNSHVNNTRYIELILDCFPPEYYSANRISDITITFSSESFCGDEIAIGKVQSSAEPEGFTIEGIHRKNGQSAFQAVVGWIKRK